MKLELLRMSFMTVLLAMVAMAAPWSASAQDYPNRPVKLIVPFPAGGPTDTLARTLGQVMIASLGHPLIVDNRTGANGNIALDAVVGSKPDGYTLFMTATSISSINPSLLKTMKVDPSTDLIPVAFVASIPNLLVVNPSVPAKNVAELVAHMKSDKTFNFGANGAGTTTRVGWVMLEKLAGFSVQHIVYRGDAPMMIDLVSNVVQASMPTVFGAAPFVRAGTLRAIGVTSLERSSALPQVPTIAESGFPGYEATTWFGITAPKGTPDAIVQQLNAEFNKAMLKPEVEQKLRDLGASPRALSVNQFRDFLQAERKKWSSIVTSSGITAD